MKAKLPQFLSAVILAGGLGSRMGTQKLLLPFGGKTIIEKVLTEVLASKVDEVIPVLGYKAAEVASAIAKLPVQPVLNDNYFLGQATSIVAGLGAVNPRATAVVFLLGDQPLVTSLFIDKLIDFYNASGRLVARPSYRGVPGHPVIMDASYIPDLLALKGDMGAKKIIARAGEKVAYLEMDEHRILQDVDSKRDYVNILRDV